MTGGDLCTDIFSPQEMPNAPVTPESVGCNSEIGRSHPIILLIVRQTDPIPLPKTESELSKKSVLVLANWFAILFAY